MSSFGVTIGPDGEPILRDLPIRYLTALPAAGEFVGDLVSLTTGLIGLYSWDGGSWVGPLGTGGGGGAPATASYVVLSLNGSLAAERVLTAGGGIKITDGGANGPVTIEHSIARSFALMGA